MPSVRSKDQLRIAVVGPSYRFSSGLSAYTYRLSHALANSVDVTVLLLRRLVPTRLYPGRSHVGEDLSFPRYDQFPVFDGIDWYWGTSLLRGLRFLRMQRPNVLVLQWWTITALHTYLLLGCLCRQRKIPLVIEFHELQDPAEHNVPCASWLNERGLRLLVRLASALVVHSRHDQRLIEATVPLQGVPVAIVPHGPYDHLAVSRAPGGSHVEHKPTDSAVTNLLYFGLIRPYKGLEDLVEAFNHLSATEVQQFHLTVVGETWEGWTLPSELIKASPYRHLITFVNRYVSETEVRELFASADALVLPYRRASSSGPLSIGLSSGMPIVLYDIPSLVEAVAGYEGAIVVPAGDVTELRRAIRTLPALAGKRFASDRSWDDIVHTYLNVLASVAVR